MRIWYCEKHKAESKGAIGGVEHSECWRSWAMKVPDISCQLVPMRLIPDNALTALVKLVKVEYPADRSLTDIARTWGPGDGLSAEQIQALVALDGETP